MADWMTLGGLTSALVAVVSGTAGCLFYFVAANWILDRLLPDSSATRGRPVRREAVRERLRAWIFVAPALLFLAVYLLYPALETLRLSFLDRSSERFVGWENYRWFFTSADSRRSILNNLLWLLFVPTACVGFGLLVATLADRIWWGTIAKTLVFMPMAISFVGASVIWKFVYSMPVRGEAHIGLLNALVAGLGFTPQYWTAIPFWNNFFLMVILIWIQTGFAMVIFSAALRGLPEDTLEAARIDGANELQVFFRIMLPQIWATVLVVWTTITIVTLKIFDIIWVFARADKSAHILAVTMYDQLFVALHTGQGSAVAVVIMLAVMPIMVWNLRRFRREER